MDQVLLAKMVPLDYLGDQVQKERQDPEESQVNKENKVIPDYRELADNQEEMDHQDPQGPKEPKEAEESKCVNILSFILCISTFFL